MFRHIPEKKNQPLPPLPYNSNVSNTPAKAARIIIDVPNKPDQPMSCNLFITVGSIRKGSNNGSKRIIQDDAL